MSLVRRSSTCPLFGGHQIVPCSQVTNVSLVQRFHCVFDSTTLVLNPKFGVSNELASLKLSQFYRLTSNNYW